MNFEIHDEKLSISLNREMYSIDILFKCFYWYGKEFLVEIDELTESNNLVTLAYKDRHSPVGVWDEIIPRIKQDLIDFKLRDIVTKETQTIRELITAKAFAYYETEDDPASEISDPVGFNPKTNMLYE